MNTLTNFAIMIKRKPISRIRFHFMTPASLKDRQHLKDFIVQLFANEHISLESLDYIFCTDSYLAAINKEYLNHNDFTDIITFPLSTGANAIIGDIYISIDRVKENAYQFNTSFKKELHRVIIHGALHLCGYKDKTLSEKKTMRLKEDFYLAQYIVPRETL